MEETLRKQASGQEGPASTASVAAQDCTGSRNSSEGPDASLVDGIAIVGLAFRLPGDLSDEQSLWQALEAGHDLIREVGPDRWATETLVHPRRSEPGRAITFSAGVLSRIDEFDAAFFGISPREAAWMDPQQRLLMELAWEAMENAGVRPSSLAGSDCAVYVGISSLDYGTRGLDDLAAMSSHSMTGNTLSIAANRLSYIFDLHGPSLAVDTACSSSLVALHHACRALQAGEAGMALVGGVSLLLHPYPFVGFTKASMLSADGRCKVFDAAGNGYVRAEGGAVLLLKPLQKALADGDEIQAVILATGVNADGARKTGLTIPSSAAQAELMQSVLAQSGLSAQDVDFIEAHGTGTAVGDPVEVAAIAQVYGAGRDHPLPIGSVKANLGHMEAASGMAGLVKTILALKHRALPPQIHINTLNPHIDWPRLKVRPVTEYFEFSKPGPLVAGVNSFGFGGANAHVLLQEYCKPAEQALEPSGASVPPLFLSARSEAALRDLANRYAILLQGKDAQAYYDIAYAAAFGRERMEKRLALAASTPAEAAEKLLAFAQEDVPAGIVLEEELADAGAIAFVYSGNGAQWVGMGRRLLAESPQFAEILVDLDRRMASVAGFSVLAELQAEGAASRLDDTVVAQPLLFAIQVALTQLLKAQGIQPKAVAGHSVGEVAAAWASGALDLDAAIRVIVARSQAQGETRGAGRMAAVGLSEVKAQEAIAALGGSVDITIAGINSPNNVTLSGSLQDLERLQAHVEGQGVFFRLLDLDYAFHSRHMDPIRERLLRQLDGLQPGATLDAVYVSTVSGGMLEGEALDADYWWRNVREPVRFAEAIRQMATLGCRIFLEIGPHAILQRYMHEVLTAADVKGRILPTLRKEADSWQQMVNLVLRVHLLTDLTHVGTWFPHPGNHVRLPNYPWQRERHWHPRTNESLLSIERYRVHPLLGWRIPEAEWTWENTLDPVTLTWLSDHKVGGVIVYPGAAYAEMALAASREWLGGERHALEEMDILAPLVFDGEHARTLRFELHARDGSFQIKSRQRLSEDPWTLHAAGRILQPGAASLQPRIPALTDGESVAREDHYRLASALGLDYGPTFQGLSEARVANDVLEATIQWPQGVAGEDYLLHPAVLDLCYQSLVDFFRHDIEAGQGVALLPVKTGRLDLLRSGAVSRFRAHLERRSARSVLAVFELFDAQGQLLARAAGCRFRAAPLMHKAQEHIAHWQIVPWLSPHPVDGLRTELPATQQLLDTLRSDPDAPAQQRHLWFKEALPLFEALVVAFAYEAFQQIEEEEGGLDRLVAATDPYARWLADLLREEQLLVEQEGRLQLASAPDLPPAEEIWRTLEREHAAALPQLVLLGRVGRSLPHLLRHEDERRPFHDALWRTPAAEALYDDDPAYAGIRHALEATLKRLAQAMPPHARLRVLEIAPAASELPRVLLAALPEDRLDYVLAVPQVFADRQKAEYADHANCVIATLEDFSGALSVGQPLPQTFDVVIVSHVLHRSASPKALLHRAWRWLAAGGVLLLAERHPDWSADFVAGCDPAWWHAADESDQPLSSLLPPAAWMDVLRTEGFEEILDFAEPEAEGLAKGAYLIAAKRPQASVSALPEPEVATWLLIADAITMEMARHLAARLTSQDQHVTIVEQIPQEVSAVRHVVWLRGWDAEPAQSPALLAEALALTQTLAACSGQPPRLWFLARGGALADSVTATVTPNPVQAALWGFGRVVMNEQPQLSCTLIDLACDPYAADTLARLENELLRPDGAQEIVLTERARHTLVLREAQDAHVTPTAEGERFRLDFHLPGQLRHLVWLPQPSRELRDGEVEVEVQATGLNFRDVMYLMGLLPDEAVEKGFAGASLGLEFSGVVARVGPRVTDLKPGDRVMGFGSACFASHVVTRADAVALMPKEWSFEAAATVPTVFFTVYYALKHLAHLQAGERVLIHGGAGGVGLAAIQLAKHMGAEVFATAGSPEKRDFVRLLGADHVFDSRSLAFADEIMNATAGEGVDVVLNSLAGEAMRRSLSVLKPFGRFLELGKRDFFENTPIGLRPLKDNISYHGIDADQILISRPQLAARLFREVMALFREGALAPLPCRVFPAERVVDAFRVMQQARHIGKVVVSLADAQPAVERPKPQLQPLRLEKESTWLVTGGLSGFGFESARWLAEHGVSHLILVGRRGPDTPGAQERIEALTAQGVHVEAVACDITDAAAVRALIERIRTVYPPLKGVLHAAATFDDALLINLDARRMAEVLAPKLLGAWHLHQATLDVPLEHFVLYSSITTALGNPGQANYVAANAGLEGLALLRRALGLPAECIGWGPIGDAGYLTRNDAVRDSLAQRLGKPPLAARQALDQLQHCLSAQATHAVADFDWNTLSRVLPSAGSGRFALLNRGLAQVGMTEGDTDIRAMIAGRSPEEVARIVQQLVIQEVAHILAVSPERVDPAKSLHDQGLDSLMAVELALGLEQRFGIQLPVMMLNESPTAEKVTRRLVEKLLGGENEQDTATNTLDAIARNLAKQHGESVSADDMEKITESARTLAQEGARLIP